MMPSELADDFHMLPAQVGFSWSKLQTAQNCRGQSPTWLVLPVKNTENRVNVEPRKCTWPPGLACKYAASPVWLITCDGTEALQSKANVARSWARPHRVFGFTLRRALPRKPLQASCLSLPPSRESRCQLAGRPAPADASSTSLQLAMCQDAKPGLTHVKACPARGLSQPCYRTCYNSTAAGCSLSSEG